MTTVNMMTAVPTVAAMHSVAAVAATMAATMAAAMAATAAAATVLGAGRCRSKHGKAERSARGDGQKGRFTNHDTLL